MELIPAKDARGGFSEMLDKAQRSPVMVTKKDRPVAVVMSVDEYERLEEIEDLYWAFMAEKAGKEGFIGTKKSQKLLEDLLNAGN